MCFLRLIDFEKVLSHSLQICGDIELVTSMTLSDCVTEAVLTPPSSGRIN